MKIEGGRNVAVIGYEMAKSTFFPKIDNPIGESIKLKKIFASK